jgi:hypothetical protein
MNRFRPDRTRQRLRPPDGNGPMLANSLGRRALVGLVVVASLVLLISVLHSGATSLLFPSLLSLIGIASMLYYTRPGRRYYLPIIWTMFYAVGYLLALADVLLNPDTAGVLGSATFYLLDFSFRGFLPLFDSIAAGMSGLFLAVLCCERIIPRRPPRHRQAGRFAAFTDRAVPRGFWIWFTGSAAVIMLMARLGIGRTGLVHSTSLPFKLAGILVYIKNMVIPFVGFFLVVPTLTSGSRRRIYVALAMLTVIGLLGSVAFLSRGFLVFMSLPPLLFLLFQSARRSSARSALGGSAAMFLLVITVMVPLVDAIRISKYLGANVSIYGVEQAMSQSSPAGALSRTMSLAVQRVIGFKELVAVHGAGLRGPDAPWRVFRGDSDYIDQLQYDLWGFYQDPTGETAFGYGYGLWGWLYLGGSNWTVLLGTWLATVLIILFEDLFIRRGLRPLALFIAVQFGIWIWGGIDFFLLSRLVVTAVACYGLVRLWPRRRRLPPTTPEDRSDGGQGQPSTSVI